MKNWIDYMRACYELVSESQGITNITLEKNVESYLVQLMAKNFEYMKAGEIPVAIQMMSATGKNRRIELISVADECLLINGFELKKTKWPTPTYYQEMGITAYGLAGHLMEKHFVKSSKIIFGVVHQIKLNYL